MSLSQSNHTITQKQPNFINKILFTLLVASFTFAYFSTLHSLIRAWSTSDDNSQGFFIIPVSIYILWVKREKLAQLPIAPSNWGGGLVILSLLVYLFAKFAGIITLASFSILPLISGVVIYLFGADIFVECMFPIAFLTFMLPIPAQLYSSLTNPLQLFVTKISVWGASLLSIPIYREGNVINLPDRTLQVVQACSGLRSLTALLTLSAIFGYLSLKSNFLKIILFVSGIPTAIMVNVLRVFIMIVAFHYFKFDLTTGTIHIAFGMLIFVFALLIVGGIKGVLSFWDK